MTHEESARILYKNHRNLRKAIYAGRCIDNGLKKEYGPGGTTDTRFHLNQWISWFDDEAIKNQGIPYENILEWYTLQI